MADKQRGPDARTTRGRPSSLQPDVMGAVDDLVTAARSAASPVPKKARRKIKKLSKELDAVRATAAKRLRQSAKARQAADRRARQAADAAAHMASLVSTIRDTASGSMGKRAAREATPKKQAGSAQAAGASKRAAAAATPAAATKRASARTSAPAAKPVDKPAGATKAATTAKASTRRRVSATQPPKAARRTGTTRTRSAKPKPTA